MQVFGGLSIYEGEWKAQHQKELKLKERQAVIASCPVCNEAGMLEFEDSTVGRVSVRGRGGNSVPDRV